VKIKSKNKSKQRSVCKADFLSLSGPAGVSQWECRVGGYGAYRHALFAFYYNFYSLNNLGVCGW
jgi:hypothetical protein